MSWLTIRGPMLHMIPRACLSYKTMGPCTNCGGPHEVSNRSQAHPTVTWSCSSRSNMPPEHSISMMIQLGTSAEKRFSVQVLFWYRTESGPKFLVLLETSQKITLNCPFTPISIMEVFVHIVICGSKPCYCDCYNGILSHPTNKHS